MRTEHISAGIIDSFMVTDTTWQSCNPRSRKVHVFVEFNGGATDRAVDHVLPAARKEPGQPLFFSGVSVPSQLCNGMKMLPSHLSLRHPPALFFLQTRVGKFLGISPEAVWAAVRIGCLSF